MFFIVICNYKYVEISQYYFFKCIRRMWEVDVYTVFKHQPFFDIN